MVASGPSAANSCLPPTSPVVKSVPPVPTATRGIRCTLDGKAGRLNADKQVLAYCSGKLVVTRTLDDTPLLVLPDTNNNKISCLVYRGHAYSTTACKLATSGAYMASGDERGQLRVWAFDHPEHLSKYEQQGMQSAIRDLDWDGESKRIAIGGERLDARAECARVIQWDGVTAGQLNQFAKGRTAAVAMKPNRPFRLATAGMDEPRCYFHQGPPFKVIPTKDGIPAETSHTKGVQCIRYNSAGTLLVSVSTDRSICTYDGKTMEFKSKLENIHNATVYSVAWSGDDKHVMTAAGDGMCKLFSVAEDGSMKEEYTWKPAEKQNGGRAFDKVPVGGGQLGCTFVKGDIPVSVGLNGQISVMKMGSDDIRVITGHYAPCAGLALDEANKVFYTGDTNGMLCKWDLTKMECTQRLCGEKGKQDLMHVVHGTTNTPAAISGLAVTTSDGTLYSVGWDDNLYMTKLDGSVSEPIALGAQPSCVVAGTELVCIVTVKGVLLLKVAGGEGPTSMQTLPYTAKVACVSKDDKMIYIGGEDNNIHIYATDGLTLTEKHVISGKHLKPIHAMALSNDGNMIASADEKDICVLKKTSAGDEYETVVGRGKWCFHLQRISCLSWAPGDRVLASGGADDSIYLWHVEKKMKRIHYPFAHRGGLTGLSFLLTDKGNYKLLSVGVDSVVNKWSVKEDMHAKFGMVGEG